MYVTLALLLDDTLCYYLCFECCQPLILGLHAVVADQNALTASVLDECETRQQFNELLTELYDYPRYSCPRRHGKRCTLPTFCFTTCSLCSMHACCMACTGTAIS